MKYSEIITKKSKGYSLNYKEIEKIINAYITDNMSDRTMTSFLKAVYENGMNFKEAYYLTDVMIKSGKIVDLSEIKKVTVDKHSTGGVGDKTSIIILPICASLGIAVPKMSGRSLGITGGTVDKLESIPGFKSELTHKEFIEVVNKVGCADVCQSKDVALADKKIYALRDKTGYVDSIPLIASSIMSKKIACSSKNIIIDLKIGEGAFIKDMKNANKLAKLMIKIGKKYCRNVVCILTDMSTPLGRNIGNTLEIKEAIKFFKGDYDERLYKLIVTLCSYMLSISKNLTLNVAKKAVLKVIKNGSAESKFYEWINAQNGDISKINMDVNRIDVRSIDKGYVKEINAKTIGEISTDLSKAGVKKKINKSTGIILKKKIGDFVEKNEILCSIYYNKEVDKMISKVLSAYKFSEVKVKENKIILKVIK